MKIVWLINIMLPSVAEKLGEKINNSGGWMVTLARELPEEHDLAICYPDAENRMLEHSKVRYYGCRNTDFKNDISVMTERFESILRKENPDVIHIWGTEHLQSYAMTLAAKNVGMTKNVVVSIQGLVSVYAEHAMAGLPWTAQCIPSLRDVFRKDSLIAQQKSMKWRGEFEKETLKNVEHVIGRTSWDYICARNINPELNYHFNNEILRKSFYDNQWKLEKCEKYSIFVSQAQVPIKGFHFVIEAVALLKEKYPEIKVYVAGNRNPLDHSWKAMGYPKYLYKLAKEKNVADKIIYTGSLDEQKMCQQYLNAHIFVSASSIENSPNSVGEAMLLGVPTIATYAGGTKDILNEQSEGFLYQYDAPYMLAGYIERIFSDEHLALEFSQAARKHAQHIHEKTGNYQELINIYSVVKNHI